MRHRTKTMLAAMALCAVVSVGCDGGTMGPPEGEDETGESDASGGVDASGVDPGDPDDPDGGAQDPGPDPGVRVGRCGDEPPPGAPQPPPLPAYSMGGCPALSAGSNTLPSSGATRRFLLVLPTDYDPVEGRLPLLLMWHYLGGAADSMLTNGQVQASADRLRFIAAIPEATEDLVVGFGQYTFDPVWPYLNTASEARVEQEAVFFDDMVTCIAQQYPVDENCISSVGVSAGALWTAQLAQRRSRRLASVVLLSGGIGPATGVGFYDVREWTGASHVFASLVGWGGSADYLGVDFEQASLNLEARLQAGGHFVMECIHNCGHAVPPVDPDVGLGALYRFALDHPYWNDPGRSIYEFEGAPAGTPEWCALGVGQAVERTGTCDPGSDIGE